MDGLDTPHRRSENVSQQQQKKGKTERRAKGDKSPR